ncbi:MAG: OmpA family protein, partial [Epsilonproteobacteria bacterium]|nr:OmpA family protein [Campylobacterota bacterium]
MFWLTIYKEYIQSIMVEGHSDSSGLEADNIVLSKKRALSVKSYLERLRIIKQYHMGRFMHVTGYGSAQKIMHNGVEDKNASRRIKIKLELSDSKIINK